MAARHHRLSVPSVSILLVTFLLVLAVISTARAYDDGPPDGVAGDPPELLNCPLCHAPDPCPLNEGGGLFELDSLPETYEPNQLYHLAVRLGQAGQSVWGFELTVIDDTDPDYFFDDGGTLAVSDPVHTQISEDAIGTKDYLKQTLEGSYRGTLDGPVSWEFDWTAPDPSTTSVTFYVSGNAANGDFSNSDDCIYTRVVTLYPASSTPVEDTSWGRIKGLYR